MSWGELPILPLCRIFTFLSDDDALIASASCKNWRYAFRFHRIFRDSLKLKVNNDFIDKNAFLCDLFARNTRRLEIVLASSIEEYSKSISGVLSRFYDSKRLESVTISPTSEYLIFENTHSRCFIARIFLPLLYKLCQLPSLKELNLNGCTELVLQAPILLPIVSKKQQIVTVGIGGLRPVLKLPSFRFDLFNGFTALQNLSLEYSWLSVDILTDIKVQLPFLRNLVINITCIPDEGFLSLNEGWTYLKSEGYFLEVTINCICLPPEALKGISERVLNRDIPLKALRILFCKAMNMDILRKLCYYSIFLKEVVWVDSIINQSLKSGGVGDARSRISRRTTRQQTPNPLVMMCWQCQALENITLHGYWHSAHDLLGMARLRGDSLNQLNISALLPFAPSPKPRQPFSPARLSYEDLHLTEPYLTDGFVQKMRMSLGFPWNPPVWNDLHPSLRSDPNESLSLQQDYIIEIIKKDLKTN